MALDKEASSSSIDKNDAGLGPKYAVDGDEGTRSFSTGRTDDEWFVVNLGSVYTLTDINILWEAAYGKEYKLQISNDGKDWKDLIHETNGGPGLEEIFLRACHCSVCPHAGHYPRQRLRLLLL